MEAESRSEMGASKSLVDAIGHARNAPSHRQLAMKRRLPFDLSSVVALEDGDNLERKLSFRIESLGETDAVAVVATTHAP